MHLAYGVEGYFDYKQAFECAKSQDKPVILYFTGHSCANCKKMQAEIWGNKSIAEKFNNEFVLAALYVDEKSVEVPENEQFVSSNDGKVKKMKATKRPMKEYIFLKQISLLMCNILMEF